MRTKCPLIIITIEAKGCPYLQECKYCQDIEIGPQNGDSWCRSKFEDDGSNSALSGLLSCPFCGQEAGQLQAKMVFPEMGYRIVCGCCNIRINWWHTEEQARTKWNTRAR